VAQLRDALSLASVTAGYGERVVLRDVSVRVEAGEVVGLIGPNGSGKTTLVRVGSRGLAPASGSVRLMGQDPYATGSRRAARLVAVVPQDLAPAFAYSVLEIVLMGRSPYLSPWAGGGPQDWARARLAMEQTNVQHLADRTLDRLSGGERQRVVLAQALAQDAPVLLLDEPTTHLDLRHVVGVLAVVRGLARTEGKAVLAVFHDLNLAAAYCDRVYALSDGRIVAEGPPGQVVAAPLLRQVFGVEVDVIPSPTTGRPVVAPARSPAEPRVGPHARVHVVGGAGRGGGAMRSLAEAGYEVTAGVLHSGDGDAEVAERLNLLRVAVPAFSPIDRWSSEDCMALIREAKLIVVCDPPFGPGNVENLRMVLRGARAGIPVLVLERTPIRERDFTGGDATALWLELRGLASVFESEEKLLEAAGDMADPSRARSRPGPLAGQDP